MKKLTVILSIAALISSTIEPRLAWASQECVAEVRINPGQDVDCVCTNYPLSCGGPYKKYNTGYTICGPADKGKTSCSDLPSYNNYKTAPCTSESSFWGMAICAAAIIVLGTVDISVCFTAGVFTAGAACVGILAASAVGLHEACSQCTLNNCVPLNSSMYHNWVEPKTPSGNACPPSA